jgi:hypothetical protein
MTAHGGRVAAVAAVWLTFGMAAAAMAEDDEGGGRAPPDLTLKAAPAGAASPAAADAAENVPEGFYRDRQGRTMQVSFDFGKRLWLGVGYAPRLLPTGETEVAPAAFDFGATWDELSEDGRTRTRLRILDGQVRLHQFGLDIVGFRWDLSHRYDHPLLRITTFVSEPERHDLFLNVGLFTEAFHFEVAPRGIDGEEELTLGTVQATLDLWQSADLRSYVRLRSGPGVEIRIGPWGDEQRFVGFIPQAVLEGNLLLGKRAMQQLTFRLRGDFFRAVSYHPTALPGGWVADGEAAYEAIMLAINDQPVSFRVAAQAGVRGDAISTVDGPAITTVIAPGWEWKGTAGIRMSFFSPPIARR